MHLPRDGGAIIFQFEAQDTRLDDIATNRQQATSSLAKSIIKKRRSFQELKRTGSIKISQARLKKVTEKPYRKQAYLSGN